MPDKNLGREVKKNKPLVIFVLKMSKKGWENRVWKIENLKINWCGLIFIFKKMQTCKSN